MTEAAIKAKHRQRGLNAMAEHLCSTDYTDGFCSPDTNGLMSGAAQCRHHNLARNGRNCVARALGLVQAIENRGCSIVWDHDPALAECKAPEAKPTVDIGAHIDEYTDDGR